MRTAIRFYAVPRARNGRGFRAAGVPYRAYLQELTESVGSHEEAKKLIRFWAKKWPNAFSYNAHWAAGNGPTKSSGGSK